MRINIIHHPSPGLEQILLEGLHMLRDIDRKVGVLIVKNSETAARVNNIADNQEKIRIELQKRSDDLQTEIQSLRDVIANSGGPDAETDPAIIAGLDRVEAKAKEIDDQIPDAPTQPPAEGGETA